jgi:hypothetical protein
MTYAMQCELPNDNDAAYKGRVRVWKTNFNVPQCPPEGHYYVVKAESEERATVYGNTRVWALHNAQQALGYISSPYTRQTHLRALKSINHLAFIADIGETDSHTYDQIIRLSNLLAYRVSLWIHAHILELEGERDLVLATLERAIDELP